MNFREQALAAKEQEQIQQAQRHAEYMAKECEAERGLALEYFRRDFGVEPDRIDVTCDFSTFRAQATATKDDVTLTLCRDREKYTDHFWILKERCSRCGFETTSEPIRSMASLGAALEDWEEKVYDHVCLPPGADGEGDADVETSQGVWEEVSPARMLETIIRRIVRDELGEGLP